MSRWCPFAEKRPLATAQGEPQMRSHDIVCVHTMAGYLTSTDGMFRTGGWDGTESHFGLGGKWGSDAGGRMDGRLFQWQDLLYQADANLDGNPRVISIETADNAIGEIQPWTPAQVETLVRLLDWLCSKEAHADCPPSWLCHQIGIPRVLVTDSCPNRRGIAYHRLGIPASSPGRTDGPWLKAGCEKWSSKGGKVCPSDARIAQLKTIVVPRVAARQLEETFMSALTDDQQLELLRLSRTINQRLTDDGDVGRRSKEITIGVRALLARDSDVDEAEVARQLAPLILAGMPVDEIADAVVEALPDDQAQAFLDALAIRIAG